MVAIMAKPVEQTAYDDLVVLAKTQAGALGRLYELYYDRIFRFCVHRLFNRSTAEDVTSSVFLTVARMMREFKGCTEQDFRCWIYTIAANQANAHIRKTSGAGACWKRRRTAGRRVWRGRVVQVHRRCMRHSATGRSTDYSDVAVL
jgi:hypothetical protein